MKHNFFLALSFFFIVCLSFINNLYALGISTEFNNIFVENLQIGQEYNLTKLLNLPCKAKNNSDKKVKIKIQPVYPVQQSLKPGFEVIPSTEWIKISNPEVLVEPQSFAVSDVIIRIPNEKNLLGKKFQVNIWFYISSIESEGGFLAVTPGVEGSLLFSISPEIEKQKFQPVDLNFELEPREIYSFISSTNSFVSKVEIKNLSKKTYIYAISQKSPYEVDLKIKEGYEPLPDGYLIFSAKELKIKKKKSKMFNVYFDTTKNIKPGNYFALIEINTSSKGISGSKYLKVFLEVK